MPDTIWLLSDGVKDMAITVPSDGAIESGEAP
jgi:hypothetical protein